ncbi:MULTISPECIES: DNA methyltransferase [Legionella]|uniref:Methyltransferase n=1 Tax=Legionella drozanskii LLAP-1 TaxID=1212489 RepID=A0A0W0SM22_9GAMM|nr:MULTISPECIES: DNA methyltransferase [Legionella]KTC84432.1 Modification methylase DpnIIB [Legionella drozanskii LLAP-1]PJE05786.1 MAG: site-specific DNA-methyltransferase [Legionella sp.]
MEANDLTLIGKKHYGTRWKTPLAHALGYRRETISRWASGKQIIPVSAAKALCLLDKQINKIQYKEKRHNAEGIVKIIGSASLIHGDARKVALNSSVDVILTDPVWPNAIESLSGSHDPFTLLSESLFHLSQFLTNKGRIIIQLRCDSDPRILNAVPNQFSFIRTVTLPYALPSKLGRILITGDVAYIYGTAPRSRAGNHLLPGQPHSDFCPPAQPDKYNSNHPCPRNLSHVEWLVEKFTEPGDIILDPFMGSGTTAVAALNRGRNFIGIEIDKKFIVSSEKRIEKQINQFL